MSQKANIQANLAVVKTGVAGERCQIHTRIIRGASSVHCLLKAENSAVELGGNFDIVHDDVDAAGTAMIRHGFEADWTKFVRLSDEWDSIHACGALLRETGQLQSELMFTAGPTDLCVVFLNWEPAVGGGNLRQSPGPLRVRRAHDLGWNPVCGEIQPRPVRGRAAGQAETETVRGFGGQVESSRRR